MVKNAIFFKGINLISDLIGSSLPQRIAEQKVSIIICTRNRGDSVLQTLESIFNSNFSAYEVILVDQSVNADTQKAISAFQIDSRFHYVQTDTQGAGRARNRGIADAKGDFILITDDDCIVPPVWMETIVSVFLEHPDVGVIFSNVLPDRYDSALGVIPNYQYSKSRIVHSIPEYTKSIGMGAGMSIRRKVIDEVGLFDENLGPGSTFYSGEDHDFAIRTLLHGWWIYEAAEVDIIHNGFRTYEQFRQLTRRDWIAIGAVHAKFIKCGHWGVLPVALYNLLGRGLWYPISMVFQWKRPQGFKRFFFYWEGFFRGLRAPVNQQKILFL